MADDKYIIDETGARRLRNTEFVLPIVVGTVSFYLGKKATEFNSHRWTVYLRGLNNEDLSYIISKVTFELHHTFNNPARGVEQQPFEVSENGWGEFDIAIKIQFTADAREKEVLLYHHLKLHEDENYSNQQNPKKPVVAETFEELVFSEPVEEFYNRVSRHRPVPQEPASTLMPYFQRPSEADELEHIRSCRAKVAAMVQDLRKEFEAANR